MNSISLDSFDWFRLYSLIVSITLLIRLFDRAVFFTQARDRKSGAQFGLFGRSTRRAQSHVFTERVGTAT